MIKFTLLVLGSLCIFNLAVHANPPARVETKSNHKEEAGLGLGAIIGGLIAGPPGAIIGAAGGAWFGNREKQEDIERVTLEKRLIEKQGELVALQSEFQQLQSSYGQQLRRVKMEKKYDALQELSKGVSLTVYFRTNSAEVDSENILRIKNLAAYLKSFPEIQIQLDAHADRRGDERYNRELSEKRARVIRNELTRSGLDSKRIHSHAYGESQASSAQGDTEGYIFDRRVSINLTLDTQI